MLAELIQRDEGNPITADYARTSQYDGCDDLRRRAQRTLDFQSELTPTHTLWQSLYRGMHYFIGHEATPPVVNPVIWRSQART